MKTRFLFILLLTALVWPLATRAQTTALPNGNFETWVIRNGVESPANWITTDDIANSLGLPPQLLPRTVTKSAEAHSGSFAAQLQNSNVNLGTSSIKLPGSILKGSVDADGNVINGVPFTDRPARLQFWYKLTGPNAATDSAIAVSYLSNNADSVALGAQVLAPQTVYTLADLPLRYISGARPDTLQLAFIAGVADEASTSTVLVIDDVQLVGNVTSTRASSGPAAALQVYPNPSATGEFSIASLTDAALATAPFSVTDATGREVLRQGAAPARAAHGRLVDLRAQRAGVYLLRLETPAGPVVRKLVIQ